MIDYHPPREAGYWEALGRFIEAYAEIEHVISSTLWSFAKVSPPIAQAIFSGTRADAATKLINRILDGTKARKAIKEEFAFIFAQLNLITEARNLIVHYETTHIGGKWVVTNRRIALDKKRLRQQPISVSILTQMSADLEKISIHLYLLFLRNEKAKRSNISEIMHAFAQELLAPWQYKPLPNRPGKRKKRGRRGRSKVTIPTSPH